MNQTKTEKMVAQLMANAAGIRYGCVTATAKMHDGRVVSVSYSTTEYTRDQIPERDTKE